ncbi:hypothetical protein [Phyllobacterium phragmitis]|uniref:Uncharacterized protein n=1 Tax=Phyllobacterium phragmitis TaxID=2670329 RepID=A0ABQ0H4K9_9HYPH
MPKYKIAATLDRRSAPDTNGTLDPATSPNKITMTISVTNTDDGSNAGAQNLNLQVSPAVPSLFDADNKPILAGGENLYPITTGADGTYKVQFMAGQNTYADISIVSDEDFTSIAGPYTIFFGSYDQASPSVPLPILPLNDDDVLVIPSYSPYFIVNFIPFTPDEGKKCIVLLNGNEFYINGYEMALNQGMQIPTAHLDTSPDGENKLSYFIENLSGAVQSSPAISFKAQGTAFNHPNPTAANRSRKKRPYLQNHAYAITNTTTTPVLVSLDFTTTEGDVDYLEIGDDVTFTVYINGWIQGTYTSNITVFDLNSIVTAASLSKRTVTAAIPASKIAGFGANMAGTPGELEIDYTVNPDGSNPSRPQRWMTGIINTVGPSL